MPTTITSYTSFTANTKAIAAEVNGNFDNHRGSLLPIETNTQTASDLSHDLGSTDHRWTVAYLDRLILAGDTIAGNYFKSTSTGATAHYVGNAISTHSNSTGVWSLRNIEVGTISNTNFTQTAGTICTLSITTYGGIISFYTRPDVSTNIDSRIRSQDTAGAIAVGARLAILRDGVTFGVQNFLVGFNTTGGGGNRQATWSLAPFVDLSASAAGHTYHITIKSGIAEANAQMVGGQLVAIEL